MRNVFVIGLDDLNHAVLQDMPGAHDCQFHQLLTREDLQEGTVSVPDLLARAERHLAAFDGPIDAIVGYWDFPSTLMVPLLCEPRGLRSASLEAVVKCEHKYWSRLVQQDVIDEHPAFGLIDLDTTDVSLPAHMSYPVWIKPIESHSSKGAHYIENEQHLHDAIPAVRETVEQLSGPFRDLLDRLDFPDDIVAVTDRTCLVEEAATGQQVTVEGFCRDGEAFTYGVVDSITYDQTPSFLRYQYPSTRLSQEVQDRMCDVARRVMVATGLDDSTFNIEFFWDPETDDLSLLEINARHSQSHAQLFEHVDGVTNHAYMLDLALGREPTPVHGQGRYGVAAKWYIRHFTDGVVTKAPNADQVAALEQAMDGVKVDVVSNTGDRLSQGSGDDSFSYVLAEIHIGADDEGQLVAKYEHCVDALRWDIGDVDNPEQLDTMNAEDE